MPGTVLVFLVVLFGGLFAMIFGIVYLRTRENLAMMERGINPRQKQARPAPFYSLKYGLMLFGAGVGLLMAYFIDRALPDMVDRNGFHYRQDNPAIYFALIAAGGGLGLIISYFIEKKAWDKMIDTPANTSA